MTQSDIRRRYPALLACVAALLVGGCVTLSAKAPNYSFHVVDDPKSRVFVFELASLDDRALCTSADTWPVVMGSALSGPNKLMTSRGEIQVLHIGATDAGMLCGLSDNPDCGMIRIEAHETLRTEISYDLFPEPDALVADDSKHFSLTPGFPGVRVCRKT